MPDTQNLLTLRKIAKSYEDKLSSNPDFVALQAIQSAIAAIEGSRANHSPGVLENAFAQANWPRKKEPSKSRGDLVAEILDFNGAPLNTTDLLKELANKGNEVGGKDPSLNLASSLSRDERFRSVSYHGERRWWFSGQPFPGEYNDPEIKNLLG